MGYYYQGVGGCSPLLYRVGTREAYKFLRWTHGVPPSVPGPGMGRSQSCRNAPRKDPPLEMKLGLTLEELYVGVTKKMKISRNVGSLSRTA